MMITVISTKLLPDTRQPVCEPPRYLSLNQYYSLTILFTHRHIINPKKPCLPFGHPDRKAICRWAQRSTRSRSLTLCIIVFKIFHHNLYHLSFPFIIIIAVSCSPPGVAASVIAGLKDSKGKQTKNLYNKKKNS